MKLMIICGVTVMAVGPEIESIRYDDLPSPEQVGRLAARLVEFAQRHDKLSTYGGNSPDDSLKHVVKPVQYFEASSLDIPDVYLLQIRTGAHVEDYPDGARRLRVFDSLIRKEFGLPGGLGVRSIYDFAWTESQTIDARRRLTVLPSPDSPLPMIDVIDQMMTSGRSPFRDDDAIVAYMISEIDHLSVSDTEHLTKDIDRMMSDVDEGRLDYRQPDHMYDEFIVR